MALNDELPPPPGVCQFAALKAVAVRTCPVVGGVLLITTPNSSFALIVPEPMKVIAAPVLTVMLAVLLVPEVKALNEEPLPAFIHRIPVTVELRICPLVPTEFVPSASVPVMCSLTTVFVPEKDGEARGAAPVI
jgi:hypothetical protein